MKSLHPHGGSGSGGCTTNALDSCRAAGPQRSLRQLVRLCDSAAIGHERHLPFHLEALRYLCVLLSSSQRLHAIFYRGLSGNTEFSLVRERSGPAEVVRYVTTTNGLRANAFPLPSVLFRPARAFVGKRNSWDQLPDEVLLLSRETIHKSPNVSSSELTCRLSLLMPRVYPSRSDMSGSRDTDMPGSHGSEHDFVLGSTDHAPLCDTNWRMLPPVAYEQPAAPRRLPDQTPRPRQGCSSPGFCPGVRQRQGCGLSELEADTPYHAYDVWEGSPRATTCQGKQQTGTFLDPKALYLSPHCHDEALRKGRSPNRRLYMHPCATNFPLTFEAVHRSGQASANVAGVVKAPQRPAATLQRTEHQVVLYGHESVYQAEMQKDGFPGRSSPEYVQHAHILQITDGRKSPGGYPRFGGNARHARVPWTSGEERHLRNMICFVQSSVWYRVQENMPCQGFPPRAISEYMRQYNSEPSFNGDAAFGCSFVGETQDTRRPAFF
ncbi:hypothetical protein Q7P37_009847 [Cladosporium fusiforme]